MNVLNRWYRIGQSFEDAISDLFEKKGKCIARHPFAWMLVLCSIAAICAVGIMKYEVVVDTDLLWTPQDSKAYQDLDFIEDNFEVKPLSGALLFEATQASGNNLISLESFETMWDAHDKVMAVQTQSQTFSELCNQHDAQGNCYSLGVLQFFKMNRTYYNSKVKTLDQLRESLASSVYPDNSAVPRFLIFGKTVFSSTTPSLLLECDAMLQSYYIRGDDVDLAIDWERKMTQSVDDVSGSNVTIYRTTTSAYDYELADSIDGDYPLMYTMFALFVVMTFFTLSKGVSIDDTRVGLSMAGLVLLGLAVAAGIGICAGLGVAFTSIHALLPVLVACVGVHDMYLITAAFDSQDPSLSVEERMGQAMRQCGKGLLYTALAVSVAFYIGSMSRYYALEAFCYYAGTMLFVNYVLQANVFCAAVCLDAHRREGRKWDIFCCVSSAGMEQTSVPHVEESMVAAASKEGDSGDNLDSEDSVPGPTPADSTVTGVRIKEAQSMTQLEYFFSELYYPVMAHPAVRVLLVLGFAGLLIANIFGTFQVKQRLEVTQLLAPGSFVTDYFEAARSHQLFSTEQNAPAELVFHDIPYHNQSVQEEIFRLQADFVADAQHNKAPCYNWLAYYYVWANAIPTGYPFKPVLNSDGYYTDESKFYTSVKLFLDTSGASLNSSVRFMPTAEGDSSPSPIRIRTSRIQCFHNNTRGPQNTMATMDAARDLIHSADFSKAKPFSDASNRDSFVYSQSYIKGEGYKIADDEILNYLWRTLVGVAAVSVALLKPHSVVMLALPVGLVAATYTNVIGNMSRWDMRLNYNFMVIATIVMTTAVIVNYILQVLQHYHTQPITVPSLERMKRCMVRAGPPVFMAVLTTLIAIIPIAFGKSYTFKAAFRMMFCALVYSAGHVLLLLPAVLPTLSYLCCESYVQEEEEKKDTVVKAIELVSQMEAAVVDDKAENYRAVALVEEP